jgi:hypothetical protein
MLFSRASSFPKVRPYCTRRDRLAEGVAGLFSGAKAENMAQARRQAHYDSVQAVYDATIAQQTSNAADILSSLDTDKVQKSMIGNDTVHINIAPLLGERSVIMNKDIIDPNWGYVHGMRTDEFTAKLEETDLFNDMQKRLKSNGLHAAIQFVDVFGGSDNRDLMGRGESGAPSMAHPVWIRENKWDIIPVLTVSKSPLANLDKGMGGVCDTRIDTLDFGTRNQKLSERVGETKTGPVISLNRLTHVSVKPAPQGPHNGRLLDARVA